MQWPPPSSSDPRELRALAHPRRLDLLELLLTEGPLTATECAERLSDSPANCSYHLRTLARFGHVEEAAGGRGRQRRWMLAPRGRSFDEQDGGSSPAGTEAAQAAARVFDDRRLRRWRAYRDSGGEGVSEEWRRASFSFDAAARVTASEMQAIQTAISGVLEPYVRRTFEGRAIVEDAELVLFLNYGFPLRSASGDGGDDA